MTLENKAEYDAAIALSRTSANSGILHFRLVGQPDSHNLIGLLICAAVAVAILLYSTNANLAAAKPSQAEIDGNFARVAVVPIVMGSVQKNDKFEKMTYALKEIESTITDLSAEKEPVENILVIDGEGHVNISSEGK
jgi:hypothetical protein